jgi:hypothetical protein
MLPVSRAEDEKQERGIMKRFFKVLFFAWGWIGLLLNLIFVLVSFGQEAGASTSAFVTATEVLWIGGCTFFGLGALIIEGQQDGINVGE